MSAPAFVPADRDLARVHRTLHSRFLALQAVMRELLDPIFATEGMRIRERQAYLYAIGRDLPGRIVTYAKPGESLHERGLAVDFAFDKPKGGNIWKGPWEVVGEQAERLGLVWGGRWKRPDRPHLQLAEADW